MNKRWFVFAPRAMRYALCIVGAVLFALSVPAVAQQSTSMPRIGFLSGTRPQPRDDAFRQGLRDLGYVEGQNIVIEWRYAQGKPDQISRNAAEVVLLKVDAIVTGGATDTGAAQKATSTIPIVMAQDPDPVANGFVASLARPGGNIIGLSAQSAEINGKQLELLKDIVPRLSRVAVLGQSTSGANARHIKELELAAGALRVQLQYLDVLAPEDIDAVFREASKARADAVLALAGPVLISHRKQVADIALRTRLPAIHARREFVEGGGSYFTVRVTLTSPGAPPFMWTKS